MRFYVASIFVIENSVIKEKFALNGKIYDKNLNISPLRKIPYPPEPPSDPFWPPQRPRPCAQPA